MAFSTDSTAAVMCVQLSPFPVLFGVSERMLSFD